MAGVGGNFRYLKPFWTKRKELNWKSALDYAGAEFNIQLRTIFSKFLDGFSEKTA